MPELPEVETIVRDLRPLLVGRCIRSVSLSHDDVLRGVTRRRLLRRLKGATIREVTRRGKHAVFHLGSLKLVVQPGMTGSLMIHHRVPPDEERYTVLRVGLDDGRTLVYHDVRRLGTLLLLNDVGWNAYTAAIGPEPLDPGFTAAQFREALGGTRQAIKKAVMDQRLLAGVGNIYAKDRKSTRLNSSHIQKSRMPSSA